MSSGGVKKKATLTLWGGSVISWTELLLSCGMLLCAGNLYAFNAYSAVFKSKFDLRQTDVERINWVGNLGLCFATPAGLIIDRFGSRVAAVFGGVLGLLGYVLLFIALKFEDTFMTNYIWLCVVYAIVGQGSIFTYMAGFMRYKLFAEAHRGKIVGVLDCMFGLSAFVISLVYDAIFSKPPAETKDERVDIFFLVLGAMLCLINIFAFFMRDPSSVPPTESAQDEDVDDEHMYKALENGVDEPLLNQEVEEVNKAQVTSGLDVGGFRVWLHMDYLLLAAIATISISAGLLYINNVTYIVESLSYPKSISTHMTFILPLSGGFFRAFSGVFSDLVVARLSRGVFLTVSVVLGLLANLLFVILANKGSWVIYVVSTLQGLSFGTAWCVIPLMISELFGSTHFGYNWGNIIVLSAVGFLPFTMVQGAVYHAHETPGENKCFGLNCWGTTFYANAGVMAFAALLSVIVTLRTRKSNQWI